MVAISAEKGKINNWENFRSRANRVSVQSNSQRYYRLRTRAHMRERGFVLNFCRMYSNPGGGPLGEALALGLFQVVPLIITT